MSKLIYIFRNTTTFFSIENIFGRVAGEIGSHPGCVTEKVVLPCSGLNPFTLLKNALFASRLRGDLFHVTGDVHYITFFLPRRRTVLTIHDCVFLNQNAGIKRWLLKKLLLDWPVARCRLITTVSAQTKSDIIRFTRCPESKIVVIPNPVRSDLVASPQDFNPAKPVLLFIGTTPNKNLSRVIEAIREIPVTLDIIGRLPAVDEEKLKAASIDFRNSFNLDETEMAARYKAADIILFPSTFEGFGMPIIEGQKAGRPVLTSNLPPMNEVAGDAACLVDPYDPASIREGLLRIIRDRAWREQLVEKGTLNVQRFSLPNIAARYLDTYKQLNSELCVASQAL